MDILQRAVAPTPRFFKKLRLIGLILTAASGVFVGGNLASGSLLEIIKYIASAGAVLTAVSQVTVDEKALEEKEERKVSGG